MQQQAAGSHHTTHHTPSYSFKFGRRLTFRLCVQNNIGRPRSQSNGDPNDLYRISSSKRQPNFQYSQVCASNFAAVILAQR